MNIKCFLNRFLFSPQFVTQNEPKINYQLKKAAVLITFVERQNGLNVIFTERALHLRHHPGQVCFPGGKHEPFDESLQHTALRETDEEIGIKPALIEVIGQLAPLTTVSGFEVSPFIGFVDNKFTLEIDHQEVQTVFEVPLGYLLDEKNIYKQHLIANKKRHFTYCIAYQNHLIWGATAQMIKNLQTQLI
ncbi:MAG: CoA pyrophosphatase [Alteromonadales bacterium]|nr:CoA pyrophosphatase [Alteromonadales bacterium]